MAAARAIGRAGAPPPPFRGRQPFSSLRVARRELREALHRLLKRRDFGALLAEQALDLGHGRDRSIRLRVFAAHVGAESDQIALAFVRGKQLAQVASGRLMSSAR